MNVSELRDSKFIKKEDVGEGVLVTIQDCMQVNVAMPGAPEEHKWALRFAEMEKPLVLNSTNGQLISKITGSEESDNWIGRKIVLYTDHGVTMHGKVVGGVRVRAPRQAAKVAPNVSQSKTAPAPAPARQQEVEQSPETESDDVPF